MRYAILSDIHANLEALTAVLEYLTAQRIDHYLCLGDIVGYGADPAACLMRLQDVHALTVAGNHEFGCIGKLGLDWFHYAAKAAIEWTREQLGFMELDQLRRLPLTLTEGPYSLVHSSLRHPERFAYLVDTPAMVDTLHLARTPFCFVGHTHWPCIVSYDNGRHRVAGVVTGADALREVRLEGGEAMRHLINPGSVGQPRDGDPRASVAILDAAAQRVGIHRVPYDVAAAQRKIRAAGLPAILADRLSLGR